MIELLAPAGDLEKLKIALTYGADAVFIGGQSFSLRARASNFDLDTIKEAVEFAHNLDKKVYVTTNIIPHQEDKLGLIEYLKKLEEIKVDAIICASPYIIKTARENTKLEIHLSTQQSVTNSNACNFWYDEGITRVVLARELQKEEISEVVKNAKTDIEVFIHGGMCMSYSGRCSLSNNMTDRDANRGGCAHSCRWYYTLYENKIPVSGIPFSMSSKDLSAIKQVPFLIDANVSSLKIEGRMKSLHYIATVVNAYRRLIDEYYKTKKIADFEFYENMLAKAENRLTSSGNLEQTGGINQQLYQMRSEQPIQNFVGLVLDYDEKTSYMKIEQRNYFSVGDTLEIFSPNEELRYIKVEELLDENFEKIDVARHPKQILFIKSPFKVSKNDMVRVDK